MSGYLASIRERVEPEPSDPLVLDLESDDAGEVLGALTSGTARSIVQALHDTPSTLSEVAEMVGTSRQNAQYHLKQLESVGAVRIVDTVYSEKGREMKVYAPGGDPMVIVSGADEGRTSDTISKLFGPITALGMLSVAVQLLTEHFRDSPDEYGEFLFSESNAQATAGDDSTVDSLEASHALIDGGRVELDEPITVPLVDVGQTVWEAYPGLVFFLGSLAALVVITIWTHHRAR